MQAYLENSANGLRHELADFCVIGRGKSAHLRLNHGGVSREHASIRRQGNDFLITDLGSSNGTYVNGLPVSLSGTALHTGDEINVGTEVFVFNNPNSLPRDNLRDSTIMTIISPAMRKTERVTLLVGDIKGYTQLSELISPMELSERVSRWCDHCRILFQAHGGMVEKFIGDCVFAWWRGADIKVRAKALAAAKELANATHGDDALACCVGLHIGEVALSRTGPNQFTLLGADVNLTFRIEALTRNLQVPILASAQFVNGMNPAHHSFKSHGCTRIKGLDIPVEVFSLVE
jgi:adenylate cyclase